MDAAVGVLVGLVAGTISGMFGVGGGTVPIPAMVLLLSVEQHTAQGVALGAMLVTATAGALTHYRQRNIDLKVAIWIVSPETSKPRSRRFSIFQSVPNKPPSDNWDVQILSLPSPSRGLCGKPI